MCSRSPNMYHRHNHDNFFLVLILKNLKCLTVFVAIMFTCSTSELQFPRKLTAQSRRLTKSPAGQLDHLCYKNGSQITLKTKNQAGRTQNRMCNRRAQMITSQLLKCLMSAQIQYQCCSSMHEQIFVSSFFLAVHCNHELFYTLKNFLIYNMSTQQYKLGNSRTTEMYRSTDSVV